MNPLHNELMRDPKVQEKKLGPYAKRSTRNEWAEQHEQAVRDMAPFPTTYDVNAVQPTNFSEYTYTELAGGLWIATQSLEINARLFDAASRHPTFTPTTTIAKLEALLGDKYLLKKPERTYKRVCFLPGHNMLDVASMELICRLAHEEPDVVYKLHPVTNADATNLIRKRVGWHRIIGKDVSGMDLLRTCDEVYTSSASEMAITGTILGKKVFNVSNFFFEGSGSYHSISRLLFLAHRREGVEAAQRVLAAIVECPWSGVLFPFHDDVETRIATYYNKTLELREMYKPLAAPMRMVVARDEKQ
jgi:hypothetical protein